MKFLFGSLLLLLPAASVAQDFSCPAGQADVLKYFVMNKERRASQFLDGSPNPIYTQVFPDNDFASRGYWFWLKSPKAHGFDVKSFDEKYVYMRSTELAWKDNTSFKRFEHDLPIAARCVPKARLGRRSRSGTRNLCTTLPVALINPALSAPRSMTLTFRSRWIWEEI
jgi:hypothetical protein